MSGFSRHWLRLREAADHRSRHDFCARLRTLDAREWTIVDLGCGSGSNLRYLQPRLEGVQRWTCIDNDADLLASLSDTASPVLADLDGDIRVILESALHDCDRSQNLLITASALLDLVSDTWLDALAKTCASERAAVWFALTFDGRIELAPAHADDAQLRSLINAHQLTDKGFGPALGPQAHAGSVASFERAGFQAFEASSDWLLSAADTPLLAELISGWLTAAREQAESHRALADWETQRLSQLEAGQLQVRVGHMDLLAMPRNSA